MKNKVILMLAAVCFTLAACVNENPEREKTGEGKAWLALDISAPAQTRALNNEMGHEGEPEESKVKTIKVILFDASACATNVVDLTYQQSGSRINTKAFQVSEDAKSILVVVNPSNEFNMLHVGQGTHISEINKALSEDVDALTGPNGFMMTNAAGRLEPWSDLDDIQHYTAPTETAAYGKRFSLTVDRVVAKVRMMFSSGIMSIRSQAGESNNKISFNDMEWCLNITNKQYFPVSERKTTANNYNGNRPWSDIYDFGGYRVDPNYGEENPCPKDDRPNYAKHFNFISSGDGGVDWSEINWQRVGRGMYDNHLYCLENTFDKEHSMHAFTTHAVLKVNMAPFYPVAGPTLNDQSYYINSGESWFSLFGMYYSVESLASWMVNNPDEEAGNALLELFNGLATEVLGGDFFHLMRHEVSTDKYFAVVEQLEEKLGYRIDSPDYVSPGDYGVGHEYGGLCFYNHGFCYYQIMIKHDSDDITGNNLQGEYGVVRNSLYDIHIQSISGPGLPTIPDPETEVEIPNESDDRYLSVMININPWTWYEQTENL